MNSRLIVLFLIFASSVLAQPPLKNPIVEKIVSEVSTDNLRATIDKLVSFGTRHTLSDTTSLTRGIGAARRWIKAEFERYASASGGRMTVTFQESLVPRSARVPYPTNVVNVVATLRPSAASGGAGERILVVGGHYDSRASNPMDSVSNAPGANDDGSGTALALEMARVMSKHSFDAMIVFIAYAGEEQGLLGATQFAEMAKKNSWNIEAVFNNDIVGNTIGGEGKKEDSYVRLFSEAFSPLDTGAVFRQRNALGLENDGTSRTLARYIKEVGELYNPNFDVKMVYRLDRFLRGGDHRPFHERGYRAVRFTVARENYDWQHQDVRSEKGKRYGDLPEFMDFDYLTKVTRINAAALASLALAPAPPSNTRVMTAGLGYDTELRWNRNKETDIAGYFVRYRETTSSVWQYSAFTRDTTMALGISKDDYLFGVQAVDKEGNMSLVSVPLPSSR